MIRVTLLLLVGLIIADAAQACNRCGLFGNRCRYSSHYVAPAYVAPVVVKQPDLLVVQNNYPAPLAVQGQTVYGYQAAAAQFWVNPAEVLHQAAQLSQAASLTAQIGLSGYNETARTQLSLQASIAEPLIRGQAASQVLNAAGLSRQSVQQTQTIALRLFTGNDGRMQVETIDPTQLNARVEANTGDVPRAPQPQEPQEPQEKTSILTLKCSKCHGLQLAEPKGEIFLAPSVKLTSDQAWKALRLVKLNKMPPSTESPLTPAEKAAVLDELDALTQLAGTE